MAWTTSETVRIEAIEETLNEVQMAITNLMSKQQMRQMLLLKQEEIDALTRRVIALESQITVLQGRIE